MPDKPTAVQIREHAAEILLDHARDVERLSIREHLDDHGLDDHDDTAVNTIQELISTADITITWPDRGTTPIPADQLAEAQDERARVGATLADLRQQLDAARTAAQRLLNQEQENCGSGREGHLNENDLVPLLEALGTRYLDEGTAPVPGSSRRVQDGDGELPQDLVDAIAERVQSQRADAAYKLAQTSFRIGYQAAVDAGSSRRAPEPTDDELAVETIRADQLTPGRTVLIPMTESLETVTRVRVSGSYVTVHTNRTGPDSAYQWRAGGEIRAVDALAAGESQVSEPAERLAATEPTLNSVISPLIILAVKVEALAAHLKHGPKALTNPDMPVLEKLAALVEECGEVGRALTYDQDHAEPLVKELIQVASVALSWIESIEGEASKPAAPKLAGGDDSGGWEDDLPYYAFAPRPVATVHLPAEDVT